MSSAAVAERLKSTWETPKSLWGWFATVDHKEIAPRYLFTAMAFLIIGGVEALIMRIQLSRPNQMLVSPEMYNQLFSLHGITMIFWYAQPILSGFAIYIIPLMIGARDMAFPRMNAFTYWLYLVSGVLLYVSPFMGEAPHAGWFSYMPYTSYTYSPSHGMDFYALSLILFTLSMTGGAINFIVTILRLRAPGMTLSRMPLFLYSTLTISWVSIFGMPALTVACVFMELDRRWGTHFYSIANGGDPVLWQQLFWFFGHPWVYIIFLPATGMLSMIIPVFSRRPIVGYAWVATATVLTGAVGFSVWLHHMFTVGMSDMAMSFFSAGSMLISIFTTLQVFAWVATIWKGRVVMTTAMYYALGSVALLVIGGLSGTFTGIIPVDWQAHNTYYVVAHIHYVLIGSNLFPVFAAFYYWLPKMTGRMMNESLGKWSFWVMFVGFNVGFFPMHIVGLMGMPRRIFTYAPGLGFGPLNMVETIGAFVLGIGILMSIINFAHSMRFGALAGRNPWNADTLEWATDSPPEPYARVHIPTVVTRHPLWDDYDEEYDPNDERVFAEGRLTPVTDWFNAEPYAISKMPEETIAPLLLALATFVFFLALVFQQMWVVLGAFIAMLLLTCYWLWPREKGEEIA
ncbi:MAG TPA: cytochrome c oxidase subunit I [Acidobacteriaceae bacterium]|jgi:cytochrome c oxidase subunit 1/cytochrome c oxidase subunit I+III|nr:cytochrome c oxidase subunit I [Acidobacteriaceae bacterium]